MKKKFITVALICALGLSCTMQSCLGSFSLSNKLLSWNKTLDNKFVNELVFFAFLIVPVYEVAYIADLVVLNSIEFWSGSSPVASINKVVEGNDGKYLVQSDANGYTITSLNDGSEVRLNYHAENDSWAVQGISGKEYTLLEYVDDTRVRVPVANGEMHTIDLASADAVFAIK